MRHHTRPLAVGDQLDDCGEHYRVTQVEQPTSESRFGHASVELRSSGPWFQT
jgi:hypothetical protein